jgi:3-oxoacyl-[acyl-carrier protein] reductase
MNQSLKDRHALITGASQGLGRSIAEAYLAAGANLTLCARTESKLAATGRELQAKASTGQKVFWQACDVSVPADVASVVNAAQHEIGPIDILINNAGVQKPLGLFEEVDWNEWTQTFATNLFGPALFCRELIPHFKKQGHGKIINLSGGGATAPMPRLSAYAASKAGLVRLTETLALELKDFHIDVNAIAPGALNTRMLEEVLQAGPEKVGESSYAKAIQQRDKGGAPMEKGAQLCVFLGSAKSNGITGKLIAAQWDPWETLDARRDELSSGDIYTLRRIIPEDRGKKWN